MTRHATLALSRNGISLSAIITGQPGIGGNIFRLCSSDVCFAERCLGKSLWILYVLIRRLSRCLPTVYYSRNRMIFFYDGAAYLLPPLSEFAVKQVRFGTETALLVASEDSSFDPASMLTDDLCWYLIYATFPDERRWRALQKETVCARIIMNPWTVDEIKSLCVWKYRLHY